MGSRPHPLFDPQTYLALNPDVAAAGVHPLVHFVRYGRVEVRDPDPCFSMRDYLAEHPELEELGCHPLLHWAAKAVDTRGLAPPLLHRAAPLLLDACASSPAMTFLCSWDPCDPAQRAPESDLMMIKAASDAGASVRLLLHRSRLHARGLARARQFIGDNVEVYGSMGAGLTCHPSDIFIACEAVDAARASVSDVCRGAAKVLLTTTAPTEVPEGWRAITRGAAWREAWPGLCETLAAAEISHRAKWPLRANQLGCRALKSPDLTKRRVCLFSHFDIDGRLDSHVQNYLQALTESGIEPWLITSCDHLHPESLEVAKALCGAVISRENRGYDFAGWASTLAVWPQLYDVEELILANDSVYGPLVPLDQVFAAMKAVACDVWGMTRSREITPHLQSYFLVFRRPALMHHAVRRFWNEVRPLPSKDEVIGRYELGLERAMQAGGLRTATYVPQIGAAMDNPTSKHWRALVTEHAFPFVKVSLLRDNSNNEDISEWESIVARDGYRASLIREHLKRVNPAARALSTFSPGK